MKTRVTTIEELKELFFESVLNNTNKVSKISKLSVLSGIGYGIAKISQKAIKDIAVLESRRFPKYASGQCLDDVAEDYGISPRFGASGSSTYVCLAGEVGTTYTVANNKLFGNHGVRFELDSDVIIPHIGFKYVKVRSTTDGELTNVQAYTILKVTNEPIGHQFCVNEYMAIGGRDFEQDDAFLYRIIHGANLVATGTIQALRNVLSSVNNNVLRLINYGTDSLGKIRIGVVSQNGIDFTDSELDYMKSKVVDYLSWSDMDVFGGNTVNILLENASWFEFDIDFRCNVSSEYDPDAVRKDLQIKISKLYDFRFWQPDKKIEWDDILSVIKGHNGVTYVHDLYFEPRADIIVERGSFPRIRGFRMRNSVGDVISSTDIPLANNMGAYSTIHYPSSDNSEFIETIL